MLPLNQSLFILTTAAVLSLFPHTGFAEICRNLNKGTQLALFPKLPERELSAVATMDELLKLMHSSFGWRPLIERDGLITVRAASGDPVMYLHRDEPTSRWLKLLVTRAMTGASPVVVSGPAVKHRALRIASADQLREFLVREMGCRELEPTDAVRIIERESGNFAKNQFDPDVHTAFLNHRGHVIVARRVSPDGGYSETFRAKVGKVFVDSGNYYSWNE